MIWVVLALRTASLFFALTDTAAAVANIRNSVDGRVRWVACAWWALSWLLGEIPIS